MPLVPSLSPLTLAARSGLLVIAATLAACSTTPPPSPPPATPAPAPTPAPVAPAPTPAPPPVAAPTPVVPSGVAPSQAADARSYRRDAAQHLYALNRNRIYAGTLPPLLYAVGVMEVEIDAQGQVRRFGWMRAPRHAPEVMAEIERTVRQAAPYPAPARMGRVTYVDTWLWDRSGRFQLDTLTEGQRGR